MNSETIANKARRSLSRFCYEECKAYCCRKGYLELSGKQAKLITKNLKSDFLKKIGKDKYSLNLSPSCPALKDFKCSIHKSRNRPSPCHEFPLFIENNTIKLSSRCPAIKKDMLYPYIKKLISMGCRLN